jgi:exodeoxyribonuclease-3
MKNLVSWNVNGIRSAGEKGFFDWLKKEKPDIVCLQETKAEPSQLAKEYLSPRDSSGKEYFSYWASAKRRGYAGTALYSREKPLSVRFLGKDEFDGEGRVLAAEYPAFFVISAYFPNSQPEGARLSYKLDFCSEVLAFARSLAKGGKGIVISGDYNIAHEPIDLSNPKGNEGNPGYLPEERAWMSSFLSAGWTDSYRHFYPGKEGAYTWWTYRVKTAREQNIGWRLDYHCMNKTFLPRLKAAEIHPEIRGSDHCPVSIKFDA